MKKIIFCGETWILNTTHQKGFDSFTSIHYQYGYEHLIKAIEDSFDITFIPSHRIQYDFPKTLNELSEFDMVIISDVGSNTFYLGDRVFQQGEFENNKLELIQEFVKNGGGFLMIGGYYSFAGIEGRARYGMTEINDILPVSCLNYDDRVEKPQGIKPVVVQNDEILSGIEEEWPSLLGYNRTNLKRDAKEIVKVGDDPLIAYTSYGKGKSVVFTSDCAPHWGTMEFVNWSSYGLMWKNILNFISRK